MPKIDRDERRVLTLNAGSSSLKFAVFSAARPPRRLLAGAVTRIGLPGATLTVAPGTAPREERAVDAPDHARALDAVVACVEPGDGLAQLAAAGHRIVHAGPRLYDRAPGVPPAVVAELGRITELDVDHLPAALAIVEALGRRAPA